MTRTVTVEVRLYAQLRDPVGRKTTRLDLPPGSTVGDALWELAAEYPALRDRLFEDGSARESLVIRLNRSTVADPGRNLADGDTLGITPQIVGG